MVGPLLLVLRGFYTSMLLLLKMYQACPMHNLFEGFVVVWFIILVGGIFSNTVWWGACQTSCYIIKKNFFFIFSAVDRKSSHAYVEDGNVELQQFDKYGYYFSHLSTACTSLVLVISD